MTITDSNMTDNANDRTCEFCWPWYDPKAICEHFEPKEGRWASTSATAAGNGSAGGA